MANFDKDIKTKAFEGGGSSKATIGYTHDDYKTALTTPYQTDTKNPTTDYYNALKNESYKTLLNSEVQASIARDQALKYTQNSLRAKGYGNQGLTESTNLGLQSQYQTALANAANNYQASIRGIDEQHRQEQLTEQNDNFQSMTTLMSSASDSNQLNEIIKTYGYAQLDNNKNIKFDDNGQIMWNEEAMANLDENSKNQLKILYNMYNTQLNSNSGSSLNSLDLLGNQTYVKTAGDRTGVVGTLGENFGEEIKTLWHNGSTGKYTNGDVIKVQNGQGEIIYLQWANNGFNLVDEAAYTKAKNKHNMTWKKGTGIV